MLKDTIAWKLLWFDDFNFHNWSQVIFTLQCLSTTKYYNNILNFWFTLKFHQNPQKEEEGKKKEKEGKLNENGWVFGTGTI